MISRYHWSASRRKHVFGGVRFVRTMDRILHGIIVGQNCLILYDMFFRQQPISWPKIGFLFLSIGLLFLLWLIEHSSPKRRNSPDTIPQALEWSNRMLTEDAKNIGQRVFAVKWEPHRRLDGSDPYVDFAVTFVNATVFSFKKPTVIQGKAKFRNTPLTFAPQLEKAFPLPHGPKTLMIIRQCLTPGMAKDIQESINSNKPIKTVFDFCDICITFDIESPHSPLNQLDWRGAGEVSLTELTANP